jgi:hypothetical protein
MLAKHIKKGSKVIFILKFGNPARQAVIHPSMEFLEITLKSKMKF